MEKTMMLEIVTPEKKIFEGKIKSISASGIDGEFGILPGHAPFATIIAPGVVFIKNENDDEEMMAISGGYIEVLPEKAVLLVETADRPGEVDVEKEKKKAAEYEKLLRSKELKELDYDRIQTELMKEISRIRAVELLNRRRKK